MARSRPCRICRRWFLPHPRVGDRQLVCSKVECQRERHRRACSEWHAENPDYDREERLRKKVRRSPEGPPAGPMADPLHEVDWEAARDAVGIETSVIIEETEKVLVSWARDAIRAQVPVIVREVSGLLNMRLRDEIQGPAPPS